jgi:hypothetical protein
MTGKEKKGTNMSKLLNEVKDAVAGIGTGFTEPDDDWPPILDGGFEVAEG